MTDPYAHHAANAVALLDQAAACVTEAAEFRSAPEVADVLRFETTAALQGAQVHAALAQAAATRDLAVLLRAQQAATTVHYLDADAATYTACGYEVEPGSRIAVTAEATTCPACHAVGIDGL